MKKYLLPLLLLLLALGARAQTSYQVTGNVTALTDTVVTVMKGDEKFEIARGSAKVDGKLAVGSKVTVHYKMTAASIEVKDAPATKDADKAAKKKK
ncbi:MAG: hypothetical protein ABIQ12_02055 [Opitutaceae bacterium]